MSDRSVEELLRELLSHSTLFNKNGNYWKMVVRKRDKITVQSEVLQLAARLLESCLA